MKPLLIIGNGKSTKALVGKFNLINKNFDTVTLGFSFRYFQNIENWNSTYYIQGDSKVALGNKKQYIKFFQNTKIPLENIFFSYKFKKYSHSLINHGPSGLKAIELGEKLGYKEIYLIGIDLNYSKKRNSSLKKLNKIEYLIKGYQKLDLPKDRKYSTIRKIKEVYEDGSYFVEDYLRKNDVISLPDNEGSEIIYERRIRNMISNDYKFYDFGNSPFSFIKKKNVGHFLN
jgi:hypothetical protein